MEIFRSILRVTFCFVLGLLFNAWQSDYYIAPTNEQKIVQQNVDKRQVKHTSTRTENEKSVLLRRNERHIRFKTNIVEGVIDRKGGHVIYFALLGYTKEKRSIKPNPVILLDQTRVRDCIAQSGLMAQGQLEESIYESAQSDYVMTPQQNVLSIALSTMEGGVKIVKTFVLQRDSYDIALTYTVFNSTIHEWNGTLYAQLKRQVPNISKSWFNVMTAYTGGILSSDQKRFEKLPFDKMDQKTVTEWTKQGWLSLTEQYFTTAWISKLPLIQYYCKQHGDEYTLGMKSPRYYVKPGQTSTFAFSLYVGPKILHHLQASAKHLDLVLDYGLFWFIANRLLELLKLLHYGLKSWGFSIIVLTCLIKTLFFRASAKKFHTTLRKRQLQPRLNELKIRYKDEPMQLQRATQALYHREKIQVMPSWQDLINIPILFAFYSLLRESIELRHAPFLWLDDLSVKDPYLILPALFGVTGWIDQKLDHVDESNENMIRFLILFQVLLFSSFPSGLLLHFIAQSSYAVLQKVWFLTRQHDFLKAYPSK